MTVSLQPGRGFLSTTRNVCCLLMHARLCNLSALLQTLTPHLVLLYASVSSKDQCGRKTSKQLSGMILTAYLICLMSSCLEESFEANAWAAHPSFQTAASLGHFLRPKLQLLSAPSKDILIVKPSDQQLLIVRSAVTDQLNNRSMSTRATAKHWDRSDTDRKVC